MHVPVAFRGSGFEPGLVARRAAAVRPRLLDDLVDHDLYPVGFADRQGLGYALQIPG